VPVLSPILAAFFGETLVSQPSQDGFLFFDGIFLPPHALFPLLKCSTIELTSSGTGLWFAPESSAGICCTLFKNTRIASCSFVRFSSKLLRFLLLAFPPFQAVPATGLHLGQTDFLLLLAALARPLFYIRRSP
jgi:hypothetical protein